MYFGLHTKFNKGLWATETAIIVLGAFLWMFYVLFDRQCDNDLKDKGAHCLLLCCCAGPTVPES